MLEMNTISEKPIIYTKPNTKNRFNMVFKKVAVDRDKLTQDDLIKEMLDLYIKANRKYRP